MRILPALTIGLAVVAPTTLDAQWTNRYPKLQGYSHHVYVEGYELPTLTSGPIDVAASPDGTRLAYSSRGWLWILDLESGIARRVTSGGAMDFRPDWSPDGGSVVFVRDDTRETSIVLLDLGSGRERVLVDEAAIDLDPAFAPDGTTVYYASAVAGDLDLYRVGLNGAPPERLTRSQGLELRPLPHPDGRRVVYLSKSRGGGDEVRVLDLTTGEDIPLERGSIASQARPALSPDGRTVATPWPSGDDGWELRLLAVDAPGGPVRLAGGAGRLPLTPAWSADGSTVYFSEAARGGRVVLFRVGAGGGPVREVPVLAEEWGEATGRLRVETRFAGRSGPGAARLGVVDGRGHPVVPAAGQARFDGQNGRVFFHSPGIVELVMPAGEATVWAVGGLETPLETARVEVVGGQTRTVQLTLRPVWEPDAEGWSSGDHHFHLNYGGPYRLDPGDLLLELEAEGIDVATPLVANLHNRFGEQGLWGWRSPPGGPLVRFGQEVRSHFLGHLALLGGDDLFWPWVWGPGYQVYGRDDRPNGEALAFGRRSGAVGMYVHPVSRPGPFEVEGGLGSIPVELVADAVLGDLDALEVACLWSDELGTADVWHRLLNLGVPVAPSAGTDVMTDFFRTMAVGTTRVYVRAGTAPDFRSYLAALQAGRSFVTNGPLLDFRVGGAGPGETVAGGGPVEWSLSLHSAVPVERVEVLVNGAVAWSGPGLDGPGSREVSGSLELPAGGWVAARAVGGPTREWPAMDSYAFGHTSPVWIGSVGSTDPAAEAAAARELLAALAVAEDRLEAAYAGTEIPRLRERFRAARTALEARLGSGGR